MSTVNAVRFLATGSEETALALTGIYDAAVIQAPQSGIFLWDQSLPFIQRKTTDYGKSWQFVMSSWDPEAEDFTPGEEVAGQDYAYQDGYITADKVLVAHKWVPFDQMKQSHFSVLEDKARENKRQLALKYDKRMCILAARGARAAAATKLGLTIHNGGNTVTRDGNSATSDTAVAAAYPQTSAGAVNARADLQTLALRLDEDNVDPDNRWLLPRTDFYNALLHDAAQPIVYGTPSNTAVAGESQLFSSSYQSMNSVLNRRIMLVDGFKVLPPCNKSSSGGPMPNTNITTGLSKYQGNFLPGATTGTPVALAFCKGQQGEYAIGVAEYDTVQNGVFWFPQKLSFLVMSWMYVGADYMHPFCLGSIEVNDAP